MFQRTNIKTIYEFKNLQTFKIIINLTEKYYSDIH